MKEAVQARRQLAVEVSRSRQVAAFVAICYAVAVTAGVLTGQFNAPLYAVVTAVLIGTFTWIHLRFGLSEGVLWALAILAAMHLAGGLIPTGGDTILYDTRLGVSPLQLDRLVHAYGTGVLTVVAWQVLRSAGVRPPGVLAVTAALAALGAASIEEVAEFATTRVWPTHVGGYINTGWDLTFNLLGCVTVAFWLHHRSTQGEAQYAAPMEP